MLKKHLTSLYNSVQEETLSGCSSALRRHQAVREKLCNPTNQLKSIHLYLLSQHTWLLPIFSFPQAQKSSSVSSRHLRWQHYTRFHTRGRCSPAINHLILPTSTQWHVSRLQGYITNDSVPVWQSPAKSQPRQC